MSGTNTLSYWAHLDDTKKNEDYVYDSMLSQLGSIRSCVTLHLAKKLARDKHSSFLGPFVRYEENEDYEFDSRISQLCTVSYSVTLHLSKKAWQGQTL